MTSQQRLIETPYNVSFSETTCFDNHHLRPLMVTPHFGQYSAQLFYMARVSRSVANALFVGLNILRQSSFILWPTTFFLMYDIIFTYEKHHSRYMIASFCYFADIKGYIL